MDSECRAAGREARQFFTKLMKYHRGRRGGMVVSVFLYLWDMKWFRKILRGASATAVLFLFQACYGTPPVPYENDAEAEAALELAEELTTEETVETEDESAAVQTLPE